MALTVTVLEPVVGSVIVKETVPSEFSSNATVGSVVARQEALQICSGSVYDEQEHLHRYSNCSFRHM